MTALSIDKIDGNNFDKDPSMFWEGHFTDGRKFELVLKYGSIILIVPPQELVIGYSSDFPDVAEVISIFENWVATNPEELKTLRESN